MPWSNMARRLVTSARERSDHLDKEVQLCGIIIFIVIQ